MPSFYLIKFLKKKKMKTEIQNLENKINKLVMRMNNAEETLTTNATNEINSMRSELEKLINEFDLLKIKLLEENLDKNSDLKITKKDIEEIISLIDEFITDYGTNNFDEVLFSSVDIDDVELSVNYSCEVELESATIDVQDYFCSSFTFDYDEFVQMVSKSDSNKLFLLNFMPRELFDLIAEVIEKSVRDIDTSITFNTFNDFECEMDCYKKINVKDISIYSDEFINVFQNEFDFDENEIEEIIMNYHNFISEENSEENNSEE